MVNLSNRALPLSSPSLILRAVSAKCFRHSSTSSFSFPRVVLSRTDESSARPKAVRGKVKLDVLEWRKHLADTARKIRDGEESGNALLERLTTISQSTEAQHSLRWLRRRPGTRYHEKFHHRPLDSPGSGVLLHCCSWCANTTAGSTCCSTAPS